VALSVLINQWETFCELIGKPEFASDPRYDSIEHRVQHKDEVIKIVEDWLQSFESRDEPVALLDQVHIMGAPVLDTAGYVNDPHIRAREAIQNVEHPGVGAIGIPRAPFHFSGARVEIRSRAPMLGEHNEDALSAVAGYTKEKIAALKAAGILRQDPQLEKMRTGGESV
jgi:crotonobetainyl-CoA:carnitine CoA-transferase CaiB-like acyl-CoA transferase